jgi:hypothetical protein
LAASLAAKLAAEEDARLSAYVTQACNVHG